MCDTFFLIKREAKRALYIFWDYLQMSMISRIKNNRCVYVVDIDNTLTISRTGEKINHQDPHPRLSLIEYILENWYYNDELIFLSARDIRLFANTKEWLIKQGFKSVSKKKLFLVKSAKHKVTYLNLLLNNNSKVVFLDDLSYNHENGEVLFYTNVISEVSQMKLTYKGLDFISNFR